jgi:hypothetical protein
MDPATAIQLLELHLLPPAVGLEPLMDLLITAASVVVQEIQSLEPAGLMRLVNCELQLPEASLNSLVGALAHRILCPSFVSKTSHPENEKKIMAFCARYSWNAQVQVGLASLEGRHSEAGLPCVQSTGHASPSILFDSPLPCQAAQNFGNAAPSSFYNSPWLLPAVQNQGNATPNDFCNSSWTSSCGQLNAWQFEGAHSLAQWPEYNQNIVVTTTGLPPQAMRYSSGKPSPTNAELEECSSVTSTSAGDSSVLDISESEQETGYVVRNTFVHIPMRKRSFGRSRARSLDVERAH